MVLFNLPLDFMFSFLLNRFNFVYLAFIINHQVISV